MGIYGNPGAAYVQGAEAGASRQQQQETLKMQKQAHDSQMRTNENANFEMDMMRKALEESEANAARWKKANVEVNRDQSINEYIGSLRSDALVNPDEFGGDITKIQDFSRIASPGKKPPQVPNMGDDTQVRQIFNMLREDLGEDTSGIDDLYLWDAAKKLGMSGEYIAVGEGSDQIIPVDKLYGALGAQMNKESHTKFNAYTKMKNKLMQAGKGKLTGDGGEEDIQMQLLNQITSDKKLRDEIVEAGGSVPQQLTNRIAHNENLYRKESIGAASAETGRKNRDEYTQAQKNEAAGKLYKGGAEDVKHFNTLQIKDKEKKFEAVQELVESFREFTGTRARVNELLEQAPITRDAMSNIGYKIKQYLGEETSAWLSKISAKEGDEKGASKADVAALLNDKKAMAVFNRIETAIGFPMVMLIKEISGAAVTNEEREYLMNLVIGGELKNMDALTEKLDEFVNILGKRAQKGLNKKISGGKALRPNWGDMVEKEITAGMTEGIAGSTLPKIPMTSDPIVVEKSFGDTNPYSPAEIQNEIDRLFPIKE